MTATGPHVRWLTGRDMPEVLRVEALSFDQSWTEEDFLRCLRQRNCIGMVAEDAGRVVGFMVYELHRWHLAVLNFAVHPARRRTGVGRVLVAKLVAKLASHRRERITLVVRDGNLPAQLFFRACGFRAARVLGGHYADTGEDGYEFEFGRPDLLDLDRFGRRRLLENP